MEITYDSAISDQGHTEQGAETIILHPRQARSKQQVLRLCYPRFRTGSRVSISVQFVVHSLSIITTLNLIAFVFDEHVDGIRRPPMERLRSFGKCQPTLLKSIWFCFSESNCPHESKLIRSHASLVGGMHNGRHRCLRRAMD